MSLLPILLSALGGGLIGAGATYVWATNRQRDLQIQLAVKENAQSGAADAFRALSMQALQANNEQFLQLATQNLQQMHDKAENSLQARQKDIQHLVQPINETLAKMDGKIGELEMKRESAYSELKTLVGVMKDDSKHLQQQTSQLLQALRSTGKRGQWGEMQLKRVLEFSGLIEGVHYARQTQVQGMRPDVVVHLPPDKVLLIDAKVPMQNYLDATDANATPEQKSAALLRHTANLKDHIKTLSAREYTQGFNSFDWVIMFLPMDELIQVAMDNEPGLIEYAWSKNIILATPINLLALMRTVSYAHDQFKINENAKHIAKLGEDLYKKTMIFAEHMAKMGKSLGSALTHYNGALGSLERNVIPSLRRMKETGIATHDAKDVLPQPIEEMPRALTNPELLAANDD